MSFLKITNLRKSYGSLEILKNRIAEEIFDRRFDQRGMQARAAE